jgi:hypothetical protein
MYPTIEQNTHDAIYSTKPFVAVGQMTLGEIKGIPVFIQFLI